MSISTFSTTENHEHYGKGGDSIMSWSYFCSNRTDIFLTQFMMSVIVDLFETDQNL